jgi:hypothetical protein
VRCARSRDRRDRVAGGWLVCGTGFIMVLRRTLSSGSHDLSIEAKVDELDATVDRGFGSGSELLACAMHVSRVFLHVNIGP